jgi:exonuclease I
MPVRFADMRLRLFFERFRVRRRPPTGPLTTAETTTAEELRQETLVKDTERGERKQAERS